MTRRIRLLAPAKINWTLEVLHIRPDGYHEISSVLQTIDLHDRIILSDADGVELVLEGAPQPLADEPPERNLAVRAAVALRDRAGVRRGVRIELEKRIPVAAGVGGGSSDASAVLRGCNLLWDLRQPEINLIEIAGEIGSDPPFFVVGGTAAVSGRGDVVHPLEDAIAPPLLLATPAETHRGEKTARMFRALTPANFTEGEATLALRDAVQSHDTLADGMITNVFEPVTAEVQPATKLAMDAIRAEGLEAHLAGAGPSFFILLQPRVDVPELSQRIFALGFEPRVVRPLSREAAVRIEDA